MRDLFGDYKMASTSEILQSYWDMFAHRYTSEDKEYQKYVQRPADPPPILEGWSNSEPTISEILQKYEQMFAHRFTSKDEEYTKYIQRPADPPPVIEGWRNRSAGNQRHRERNIVQAYTVWDSGQDARLRQRNSETADNLQAEETDMTIREALDPVIGKKEAGGTPPNTTDTDSLPTSSMDTDHNTVPIFRAHSMAIISVARCIE
ncbi:RNA guanine-N7 methyltransferase activating subunit [Varanus komodoensis]|nr:RNA guanine-N7 methyltransferase activating subunit [Varanus komodoensis]